MMDWLNELEERIISLMESVKQLDLDGLRSPLAPESNSYIAGLHDAMMIAQRVQQTTPPTGYDVYCAQDAPAFAVWERVAWFAGRGSASHWATNEKYFYEAVNYKVVEPDAIHIDMIAHGEGDRKFRILPAGSPPPGNEVSK